MIRTQREEVCEGWLEEAAEGRLGEKFEDRREGGRVGQERGVHRSGLRGTKEGGEVLRST